MLYRFHEFELDPKLFQLRRSGEPVPVPRQVFDLILFLARNHERPVTRNELVSHVWGGRAISDSSLSRCLFLARKALGDNPRQHRFIKTIHARGYWFVAPVEVVVERGGGVRPDVLPSSLPFVGRASEMSSLIRALDAAVDSRGSLILVDGPAGIGKTRLCLEVAREAKALGISSVFVDCAALSPAAPLAPWVEALRRLPAERGAFATSLEPRSDARGMAPEWERLRRFAVLAEMILSDTAGRPRAFVLDNIEQADADSQQFLEYVSDRLAESRVIVVVSTRPDSSRLSETLSESVRRARGRRFELRPLEIADLGDLMTCLGSRASKSEAARLHARSGGNPLFLEELVRLDAAGHTRMPGSLVDAVLRRVSEVPEESRDVLSQVCILGCHFELADAAKLLNQAPAVAMSRLEPAIDRGILAQLESGGGALSFRHEVVQEALYSSLGPVVRAQLHDRAAHILEGGARGAGLFVLARHRVRAVPVGDRSLALESVLTAATWAETNLAFGQACELLESASRLVPDVRHASVDADAVALRLGAALVRAGRRAEGRTLLLNVAETSDRPATQAVGEAALSLAPGFFAIEVGVSDALLVGMLETALAAESLEDGLRAKLLARLAMALYWRELRDPGELEAVAQRCLESAAQSGDPRVIAECSIWRVGALWSWTTVRERSLDLGVELDVGELDPSARMVGHVFRIATAAELGDAVALAREADRFEVDARLTREPHSQWYLPMYRSMRELASGRLRVAKQEIASFLEIGSRLRDVNVELCAVAQAAEIALQENRAAEVIPSLRDQAQRFVRMPEFRCVAALFELAAGNKNAARTEAVDVFSNHAGSINHSMPSSLLALSALAEVAYTTGDEGLGSELLSALEPASDLHAVAGYGVVSWGSVSRPVGYLLALQGRWREAESAMEAAICANRDACNPVWALHAQLGLARILGRQGSADSLRRSREVAVSLQGRSREMGLRYLEESAALLTGAR